MWHPPYGVVSRTIPLTIAVVAMMVLSVAGAIVLSSPAAGYPSSDVPAVASTPSAAPAPLPLTGTNASAPAPVPAWCASLKTTSSDPSYASFVRHVDSIAAGLRSRALPDASALLPYAGPVADQTVHGVPMAGSVLSSECGAQGFHQAGSQTSSPGVAYDGLIWNNGSSPVAEVLNSNSVAATLTVNSSANFYPSSGTPTLWGAQENLVLPNVTILGQECPTTPCAGNGTGNYAFWTQNVLSYNTFNDTLYLVDDTWNFTNSGSSMYNSSLVDWSPNGGNYTGVWVAYSPYYYVPPPFTVTLYLNTSVNPAGDQVLWYNYSIHAHGLTLSNGNYDYLVFASQPRSGASIALAPPDFQASATETHLVSEGYEFDAFLGADDGSNQLVLGANATIRLQYCTQQPYCTPTNFTYSNVPAAVNFGSQTGEQAIGVAVNYVGTTAYLTGGPEILHGLWNYTGTGGVAPGSIPVANAITVTGSPDLGGATPYVFVFFEDRAFSDQGFQWAPDVGTWYLMPGTYNVTVLLADYSPANTTLIVSPFVSAQLELTLSYNSHMGVYTPLWAFDNAQLAGISSLGSGTLANPYQIFNNPTTGYGGMVAGVLSPLFQSWNDYLFASFTGVLLSHTSAYVDLNDLPAFSVCTPAVCPSGRPSLDIGIELFQTSHVTLANDPDIQGWPAWYEISFYTTVPSSQNPAPQADVYVWNSTGDLIMSNTFVATPTLYPGQTVSPDELVLYGGSGNVVWGNTFENPTGVPLPGDTYAGIGEADHGDLIYNNNFSVDNPVVLLPYNWPNVADCLPQSLGGCANNATGNGWYYNTEGNAIGNTWNVTPQPAAAVSYTINGFRLSGNILGPSFGTQGGNYFWNYGTSTAVSPNNRTTLPYVSRFYYSDWSNIYPLGCGSLQPPNGPCGTAPARAGAYENGIATGGDYAPYGPIVTFNMTGLPAGTNWTVTIGGIPYSTHQGTLSITEPYGTYHFTVQASGYVASRGSGTVVASGAPVVHETFTVAPPPPFPPLYVYAVIAIALLIIVIVAVVAIMRRPPRSVTPEPDSTSPPPPDPSEPPIPPTPRA